MESSSIAKQTSLKRFARETDEQRQLRLFKQSERSRISRLYETESAKKLRLEKFSRNIKSFCKIYEENTIEVGVYIDRHLYKNMEEVNVIKTRNV